MLLAIWDWTLITREWKCILMSFHFFDAFVFPSQASYFAKREDLKSFLIKTFLFPIWLQSFPLPRARSLSLEYGTKKNWLFYKRWYKCFLKNLTFSQKWQELPIHAKYNNAVNNTFAIFNFVVRPKAMCTRWSLVRKRFLFTVTWATLDAEMEGGHWPWRLMAQR